MDIFCLEALVEELAERLSGARIDKIHQPERETVVFRLWNRGEELRLLASAAPGRGRCHLTSAVLPNPPVPPRFCQLLRAKLAILAGIDRLEGERILRLVCRGREGKTYALMVELTGAHPDLVLVDGAGIIIDALRRVTVGERENLPGRRYRRPPAPTRLPLTGPLPEIPPGAAAPGSFASWLLVRMEPMSPLVARDLAAGVEQGRAPTDVLIDFRRSWQAREFRPAIVELDRRPVLTVFVPRYQPVGSMQTFPSVSEAADRFYALPANRAGSELEQMAGVLRRERKRLSARMRRIEEERAGLAGTEDKRRLGDLLMANLHRVKRGMTGITVDDLFQDPPAPILIPLDPRRAPSENAEAYFHRHRKERRGREHLERRLNETREALNWLDEIALAVEEAESRDETAAVRREMEEAGLLRPRQEPSASRRSPPPLAGICRGSTPGGFPLIWGKSSAANDKVSREFTAPDDLWFHAHRLPGCHLVLKRGDRKGEIPEADLLYAAAVAAGFSRGKEEGRVAVMVTEGRYVRKPKGTRPGLVTVQQYRTVVVAPLRPEAE